MTYPKLWVFDENHREYLPGSSGPPIWRKYWQPREITGETSRSWIFSGLWTGGKTVTRIPKVGWNPRLFAFSEADIDQQEWIQRHSRKIGKRVMESQDAELLRHIAALVGYQP